MNELLELIEKQNQVLRLMNTDITELKNEVYFLRKKVKKLEEERDDGK